MTLLNTLFAALKGEQNEGNLHAEQLVERINAHIRDLETLKAWVMDAAKARSMSIETLMNGDGDAQLG